MQENKYQENKYGFIIYNTWNFLSRIFYFIFLKNFTVTETFCIQVNPFCSWVITIVSMILKIMSIDE